MPKIGIIVKFGESFLCEKFTSQDEKFYEKHYGEIDIFDFERRDWKSKILQVSLSISMILHTSMHTVTEMDVIL